MEIVFQEQEAKPELRYADLRTGMVFVWWAAEPRFAPGDLLLKGEKGFTRISNGDSFVKGDTNPRVIRLDARVVVLGVHE